MKTIIFAILVALIASAAQAQVISPAPTQFNTWTPGVTTDGTDPSGATYTVQQGSYVITGSLVVTWFSMTLSAWAGPPTGNVVLTGLPVANNAIDYGICLVPNTVLTAASELLTIYVAPNATGGTFLFGGSNFPVTNATGTITNTGSWTVTGICWYHF